MLHNAWLIKSTGVQSGAREARSKRQHQPTVGPRHEEWRYFFMPISSKCKSLADFFSPRKVSKIAFMTNSLNNTLVYYSLLSLLEPEVFGHICWFSEFWILLISTGRKFTDQCQTTAVLTAPRCSPFCGSFNRSVVKTLQLRISLSDQAPHSAERFQRPPHFLVAPRWMGSCWFLHHLREFILSNKEKKKPKHQSSRISVKLLCLKSIAKHIIQIKLYWKELNKCLSLTVLGARAISELV